MLLQKRGNALYPHSYDDLARFSEIPNGGIINAGEKDVGKSNLRSIQQLGTYWAACKFVSENSDRQEWRTKDMVDFRIRVALQFFDPEYTIVKHDGTVVFKVRSIAFKNLKHLEACSYFERAFDLMGSAFGMDRDEFIKNVKQSIGG